MASPIAKIPLDKGRKRELCDTLGVSVDADEETIKRAYKKLALEYHPDRPNNKGKEEESRLKFSKITEAYEKLSSSHNTLGMLKSVFKSSEIHSSLEHFFFTTGTSLSNFNLVTPNNDGDLRGSGSFTKPARKGQSLKTNLKITFQESIYGCSKTIEFTRSELCTSCSNQSKAMGPICRDCGGKGILKALINGGNLSGSTVTTPCPTCSGISSPLGSMSSKDVCSVCKGNGKITNKRTCRVEVPPGASSGQQKIFTAEGDESEGGGAFGDLIVCFEVESHPFFMRKGADVYCKLPLTFPQAALGAKIEFPSLYGQKLSVTVKPGIQHDEVIVVEKEGFLNTETNIKGNLYLQVAILVPKVLNQTEAELLESLSREQNFKSLFQWPV